MVLYCAFLLFCCVFALFYGKNKAFSRVDNKQKQTDIFCQSALTITLRRIKLPNLPEDRQGR